MVSRRIPKKEFVFQVIKDVIRRRGFVESQEELCFLVLRVLKKYETKFVITPQRVKKIALEIPGIEIKAKTKKMPRMTKLKECPACKKRIRKIFGKNLLGKRIHIGYVCGGCGYSTDLEALMPMKYIFIWRKYK